MTSSGVWSGYHENDNDNDVYSMGGHYVHDGDLFEQVEQQFQECHVDETGISTQNSNWIDYHSFIEDNGAISALSFHDSTELLWIGHQTGRLTSYLHSSYEPNFIKYSSFTGHTNSIVQLLSLPKHILSISSDTVRMHTLGGLSVAQFKPDLTDYNGEIKELTCGTLFEPSGGLFRAESQKYLFLGSSSNLSYAFDLQSQESPLAIFDLDVPSVCVQSSVTFLSVGGSDGKIRLLDPSLRTSAVQHTIEAHQGGISSFSVQSDGMALLSCGYQSRSINPYDSHSPVVYHPDPIVKIFDMRMLRQVTHLALAIPPPCYVKWMPKNNDLHDIDSNVLAISSNGYIQTLSLTPTYEPIMETLQIQYATLNNPPEESSLTRDEVTVVNVSSTGQLIGVGSILGVISLHASIPSVDHETPLVQVNKSSENLTVPEAHPNPPRSLSFDSPEIATAYTLSNRLLSAEERRVLSSNFSSTPQLLKRHLKISSRLKILPDLLTETTFQGSVGSTKNNTGYPPNTFLCPQTRGHGYAICDPRFVAKQLATSGGGSGSGAGGGGIGTGGHYHHTGESQRTESVGSASSIDSSELIHNHAELPPPVYQYKRSHRGKNRIQKFNYAAHNSTPFVGLENMIPNSWTNPLLQFLFAIPEIRKFALETQLSAFHHSMPTSLTGELGFLFDMMLAINESATKHPQIVSRVATSTNFQRALQVTPDAHALFPVLTPPVNVNVNAAINALTSVGSDDKSLNSPINSPASMVSSTPPTIGFVDELGTLSRGTSDGLNSFPSPTTRPLEPTSSHQEFKSIQSKFQFFTKFLLQHLKKEFDTDLKFHNANQLPFSFHDAVTSTFAFDSITTTTFLNSQTKGLTTHHTSFCLDLAYPPLSSTRTTGISFSEVLYSTIYKTTQMRGWCAASESYEPCRQIKRIQFEKLQNILTLLCGDTLSASSATSAVSAASSSTTTSSQNNNQSHTRKNNENKSNSGDSHLWRSRNSLGGPWLPSLIEILFLPNVDKNGVVDSNTGEVYISELLSQEPLPSSSTSSSSNEQSTWLVFDGKSSTTSTQPASKFKLIDLSKELVAHCQITVLSLFGVVSGIKHSLRSNSNSSGNGGVHESVSTPSGHTVLHLLTKKSNSTTQAEWTLFNDFTITPCQDLAARSFPEWRFPCTLFFMKSETPHFWINGSLADSFHATQRIKIPALILNLNSISTVPCVSIHHSNYHPTHQLPLAFDAEFVSVEVEKAEMDSRGQRIVHDEGRQVFARISILECSSLTSSSPSLPSTPQFNLLVDDYILPIEPIVDYVTRFSGLHEEDLNPALSRHAVVPNRTAYLKLKYFIDCGHVFVGHGLQKDFDIANIFVPPEQILDTVELWRLPNQRKVSLRFLASYLLGMEIQDDLHDSIEDARTAFLLYQRYEEEKKKGDQVLQEVLRELYAFGARTNWTIGLDRISTSPVHRGKRFFHTSSSSSFPSSSHSSSHSSASSSSATHPLYNSSLLSSHSHSHHPPHIHPHHHHHPHSHPHSQHTYHHMSTTGALSPPSTSSSSTAATMAASFASNFMGYRPSTTSGPPPSHMNSNQTTMMYLGGGEYQQHASRYSPHGVQPYPSHHR